MKIPACVALLCISKEIPLRLRSVRTIGRDLTISKSAYKPHAVLGSLPTHPIRSLITCYPSPTEKGPQHPINRESDFWSPRPRRNNLFIMTWFSLSWEFLKKEIHLHIHFISQLNYWLGNSSRVWRKTVKTLPWRFEEGLVQVFTTPAEALAKFFWLNRNTAFFKLKFMFLTSFCVNCVVKPQICHFYQICWFFITFAKILILFSADDKVRTFQHFLKEKF